MFLVLLHLSSNIKITNYFNCEPRFNGAFSRNNLPRIKHGANVINHDDKNSKGTHWVSLFLNKNHLHTSILLGWNKFRKRY